MNTQNFIKVRATKHSSEDNNDTFESQFLLNTDTIKIITLDGGIILKEGINANNNCLLYGKDYFTNVKLHEDIIDDFLK